VFDWTVPKEWNIRDAYVRNSRGEKVIHFKESNLHILQYSVPVKKKLPLAQVRKHLFSIPDRIGFHIERHTIKRIGGFASVIIIYRVLKRESMRCT
jgi:aminopeptidase-like protein